MNAKAVKDTIVDLQQRLASLCPFVAPAIFPSYMHPKTTGDLKLHSHQLTEWNELLENKQARYRTEILPDDNEIRILSIDKIEDERDFILNSTEKLMKAIVVSTPKALEPLVNRFLELNQFESNYLQSGKGWQLFYDAVHVAYALKVLLSNCPGWKVTYQGFSLPLNEADANEVANPSKLRKQQQQQHKQEVAVAQQKTPKKRQNEDITKSATKPDTTSNARKGKATNKKEAVVENISNDNDSDDDDDDDDEEEDVLNSSLSKSGSKKRRKKRGKAASQAHNLNA